MTKKLYDNSNKIGNSNSKYYDSGIMIDLITIDNVVDKSNYPLAPKPTKNTIGSKGFEPELCLEITSNDKKIYVFGRFKYKEDKISGKKTYAGWNDFNNGVWSLLYNLFGDKAEINDDDTIPEHLLKSMIGKKFYRLRYCIGGELITGKPVFRDFSYFTNGNDESNAEFLYNKFMSSSKYQYDPDYYKNYKLTEKDNSVPPQNENGKDEDLPF